MSMLKRILCAALAIGFCGAALAVDAVEPATLAVTNKRAEAVTAPSQETFFRSSTLRLTNCTVYADSTTNTVQGLDGVTVEVRISNGTSLTNSTAYTGTVVNAASGTWWKDVTVPDSADCYLQVKLTDASTNVYIYPWKILRTKDALQ